MSDAENIIRVVSVIFTLAVIILHIVSLAYLLKLEKIDCPCAEHPYRPYLKAYMIVAIVVLSLNLFVPFFEPSGPIGSVLGIFLFLWMAATIAFYIMAIQYVRFLVKEKCGCSEDVRREVLYIWAVLELTLLAILFLLPLLIFIVFGTIGLFMGAVKSAKSYPEKITDAVSNPYKSVRSVPGNLRKQLRRVSQKSKSLVK